MRLVSGEQGARLIALGIAVSTVGFPKPMHPHRPARLLRHGQGRPLLPKRRLRLAKTHVPVVAIVVQSIWAVAIAFTGKYEEILNFVIPIDFFFIGLSATCLFIFRHREKAQLASLKSGFRVPGHPSTTIIFVLSCWLVVANTIYTYPGQQPHRRPHPAAGAARFCLLE
jgi:APA family basic amino acid/polyamine antiporter